MAPLIPAISDDLNIGNARMGLILGAWPLVYLVAALPSGVLDPVSVGLLSSHSGDFTSSIYTMLFAAIAMTIYFLLLERR